MVSFYFQSRFGALEAKRKGLLKQIALITSQELAEK
jgi:hypothetical protein